MGFTIWYFFHCILILLFQDTKYIKIFILDEADEMLSRGFKDQIYDVFRTLNESIQVGICIYFNQKSVVIMFVQLDINKSHNSRLMPNR